MTVLVTGGAGYMKSYGSRAGRSRRSRGRDRQPFHRIFHLLPEGVPLFIGDAADENLVEGVIAASASSRSFILPVGGGADSMRDPLGYYRNNTMTTRSLLNAAVKSGVSRFIFSSTAAVYGNPDQVPVSESAPTRPLSITAPLS